MARRILIVEDDRDTRSFIAKALGELGHLVEQTDDGREGLFLASSGEFDLIILDRMVPGLDGLGMLRALRAAQVGTPVLMLSALASVDDRIAGLESGSDDYLVKPFAMSELQARAHALMRRADGKGGLPDTQIDVGDLHIDLLGRIVRRHNRVVDLKPREYALLEYFARNADRVVTRTMLLEHVWDYHFDPGTNVIDVHISRLRRKLEQADEAAILHTVRGAGYRLGAA